MNMSTNFKLLILSTIIALSSCTKKDSGTTGGSTSTPTPTTPTTSGKFVAKVDGVSFKTDDSKASAKYVPSTKMIQIIGQNSDQTETIVFQIMPLGGTVSSAADWKPGTYTFDPSNITKLKYSASGMYTTYESSQYVNWSTKWEYVQKGSIIIESNTGTHVKGTFHFDVVKQNNDGSFDASSIKVISEGAFDLDIK
jgi:hypothetical protein